MTHTPGETVVDGIARLLVAAVTEWAYDPDAALPAGKVPVTIAGLPSVDPMGDGSAVTLTCYPGGPEPDSRNSWEYPRLQVRVRNRDALLALRLDRAAYDVLQGAHGTLPGGLWLLDDCYALNSDAQPIGRDDAGQWEYVRNYQLCTEPIT